MWSVSGWLLTLFMKRAGPEVAARMQKRVRTRLIPLLSVTTPLISLAEAITVEAVKVRGAGLDKKLRMAESGPMLHLVAHLLKVFLAVARDHPESRGCRP